MPFDATTPHPNSRVITQALEEAAEGTPSISNPLQLFTAEYDQANGDVASLSPSRASRINNNKHGPPPKSPTASSPNPKRPANNAVTATRSPFRRAAAAAASLLTQLTQPINHAVPTPANLDEGRRDGPSPTSALEDLFEDTAPPPKKQSRAAMIGHIPKSDFLRCGRGAMYDTDEVYTEPQMKKQLQQCRTNMMYNFTKTYNNDKRGEINGYDFVEELVEEPGRRTRSMVDEDEDEWMVDTSAVDLDVTDTRRLSLYPIEQLLLCKAKTRLLVLVKEADVHLLGSHTPMISSSQGTEQMVISGHRYYRLKATIEDDSHHKNARGEGLPYSLSTFEEDFKYGNGEFSVRFDGTAYTHRFNWRDVVADSSSIKFFGAPLSMTRSFDKVFKDISDLNKLYHRFISFYNEFEGDVNSCLSIYNSYTTRKMVVLQKKLAKSKSKESSFDKNLLRSKPVVEFFDKIDDTFRESQERVFTEWTIHSEPIVATDVMKGFVEEAVGVFGAFWHMMAGLRGTKPNQKKEQQRNVAKNHSVFFQILGIARMANRRRLQHYALVQNVTNFSRGVGRSAEMAISYFGQTVSNATRRRRFAQLTGNDKEGRAKGNTLKEKQSILLSSAKAVMLCYDNYQKGLTLQHQRGGHSSTFFKGTHQCAHKIFLFEDDAFNAFYPAFTQHDQAIPSPWGMPAFESLDFEDPAVLCGVYEKYDTYVSLATPEFEGKRVEGYIQLRDTASHLQKIALAFPASSVDDDDGYFDQCPSTFSKSLLRTFGAKLNSNSVAKLLKSAKAFQYDTVVRWNPHADEATMSVYLGLLAIDEAASKKCGAITLDLLLRSGVLVQNDEGGWDIAEDYKTRRIYLVGDPLLKVRKNGEDTCTDCHKLKHELMLLMRKKEVALKQLQEELAEDGLEVDDVLATPRELEDVLAECVEGYDDAIKKVRKHLDMHGTQRKEYNKYLALATKDYENNVPMDLRTAMKVIDMGQNGAIPWLGGDQPGDFYYMSPLIQLIFGVCDPATKKMRVYVWEEGTADRGANQIISCLHFDLVREGIVRLESIERTTFADRSAALMHLVLAADNCSGQNKNKAMIKYCMWLVEAKHVKKVTLLFLVKGHTKNECDRMFNLLKKCTKGKDIWTADDLDAAYTQGNEEWIDLRRMDGTEWTAWDNDDGLNSLYRDPQSGTILVNHEFVFEADDNGNCTTFIRKEHSNAEPLTYNLKPTARSTKKTARMSADDRAQAVVNLPNDLNLIPPPGLSAVKANECENKLRKLAPPDKQHYYQNRVTPDHENELAKKKKAKSQARTEKKKKKKNAIEEANKDTT